MIAARVRSADPGAGNLELGPGRVDRELVPRSSTAAAP